MINHFNNQSFVVYELIMKADYYNYYVLNTLDVYSSYDITNFYRPL
jgi:hypothetical protein